MKKAPVFDKIYTQYIADVSTLDLDRIKDRLGIDYSFSGIAKTSLNADV